MSTRNSLKSGTAEYMNAVWGLSCCEDCDDIVMLWCCGYYEEAAKLLVDAGAVEPNCAQAKDMIRVAKRMKDDQVSGAIRQILETDEYRIFNCRHCAHVHFINSLYYDDAADWRCDGCGKRGLIEEPRP